MAQNTTIQIPEQTWTLLTDSDVTAITFVNLGLPKVWVKGTTAATAPTSMDGSIPYDKGQGEANVDLTDLFPGLAAVRVYAFCYLPGQVMVSHA